MRASEPPLAVLAPRLWTLDLLRGLCALLVFVSHWYLWSNFPPTHPAEQFFQYFGGNAYALFSALTWPTGAHHPAVICFFVISGFCIHYPFARRAQLGERPSWRTYYWRRARRIYPVFWCAGLCGAAFVGLQRHWPVANPLLAFHATADWPALAIRLSGLEGLYPEEIIAGNYILVTVAAEMVMYAAYPLLYALAERRGWSRAAVVVGALHLVSLALLAAGVTPFWVFNSLFMLGIFWFAGAWAAQAYVQGQLRPHAGLLAVTWVAFLLVKMLPAFYGLNLLKQALWGGVCTLLLLSLVTIEGAKPQWSTLRPVRALRYVGEISYSLYAVHTPAIMAASWLLLTLLPSPRYWLQLAATLACSILATLVTHHAVERRYFTPRRT